MKNLIIAVDFDGTCVTHEYPNVGKEIGAAQVLKRITDAGHKIILFTMRSGKELQDAVNWFKQNDIPLFGINENPEQHTWTESPKPYAHMYIDDAAFGCPLIFNDEISSRGFVNWQVIESSLNGIYI
jgi:hydroxymethylpyrimidine pyrophosphatase-like HAD family hydrolase